MKMKATREEVYCLEVGAVKFEGLKAKSHWQGMTELRNAAGQTLVVTGLTDNPFSQALRSALGQEDAVDIVVVQGSPDLVFQLREEQKRQELAAAVEAQ